jgi:hypothetical protein
MNEHLSDPNSNCRNKGLGACVAALAWKVLSICLLVMAAATAWAGAGDRFIIHTPQGDVAVLDFRNNPVAITQDKQTITIARSKDYEIEFNVGDTSFSIGINDRPFPVLRKSAEAAFLKALGISQSDACKLNVYEGTTFRVDPHYAGKSYKLSFCDSPQ